VTVANYLREQSYASSFIARLGGDEFAILSPSFETIEQANEFGEKIIANLPVPLAFKGHKLDFGCSIGIAALPLHTTTYDQLQRYADLAMYKAKDLGRGTSVVFAEEMAEIRRRRVQLRIDLDKAITNQEVSIFFQPTMRPNTTKAVGVESLLRWEHQEFGWVPPLDILSLADDVDFPQSLTRYILQQSLIQTRPYILSGAIDWVSINLVDKDLRDLSLPDFILGTLQELEIAPQHLKIEITEHNAISDFQNATRIMNKLQTKGILFAIDDFGAGYSNMLTLDRLPFKVLKIDQSLITQLACEVETKTMVKAIIEMSHALSMEVIAEGVEDAEQESLLADLGCDYVQGFVLGLPKPIAEALPAALPLKLKL
jgi:predicted signal transduction protein with EAL and GGDEF domain